MNNQYSEYVPNVHFELIPIKNLVSNQTYQRNISTKQVEQAAQEFDVNQINPVKVSRRDGINYVFNGQHTIEIVAEVSGSRDTPVWCMIYDDLVYEHEADIFANQSKFVRPLTPYDIFVANLEAGNQEQIMIKELVESFGLVISGKDAPGNICAVASIQEILRRYGYATLDHTLRLCIATWEGVAHSLSSCILKAISILITVYGDDLDDEIFKEKLGCISIRELLRTAKERRSGVIGYAEAMLTFYTKGNRGGKNCLSLEKLYAFQAAQAKRYKKAPPQPKDPIVDDEKSEEGEDTIEQLSFSDTPQSQA